MEDHQILDLYRARNPDANLHTDRKYGMYCRQISLRILRSKEDAEECVNDTWLKTWNSIPPQCPHHLKAWLGKVTRNLSLDRWEQTRTLKRGGGRTTVLLSELSDCIPSGHSVEQAMNDKALSAAISKWLRSQTPKNRVAFVRRYWYGESIREIAQACGAGESKVKSSLMRTRNGLRDVLEKEGVSL